MAYTPKEIEFLKKMKAQWVSQEEAFKRLQAVKEPKKESFFHPERSKNLALLWGAALWLEKAVSSTGKFLMSWVGQATRLLPWNQSENKNSFYNVNKTTSENLKQTWDVNTENFLNKVTGWAMKENPITSRVAEEVAPMLSAYWLEQAAAKWTIWAGSKIPTASKFISSVVEKTPELAKYGTAIQTGWKLLTWNIWYNVASEWELPSTLSNILAVGMPSAVKALWSKATQAIKKSPYVKWVMENLTLSNFVDRTGLRNILAKVANNWWDIVWLWDDKLDELALQAHKSLWGQWGELWDDLMTGVVNKIQQNIKPWTRWEQIIQMNKVWDDLMKTVDDDLAKIPSAVRANGQVNPKAVQATKNILSAIEENASWRVNKPDLSKYKYENGQFKDIYTPSEMQEIKRLSDWTFDDMFSPSGETKKAYLDLAESRGIVKQEIEDIAKDYWIPDIANRNAEIALFKWLASSAKNASVLNRVKAVFWRNPIWALIASGWGVWTLVGWSYLASQKTWVPQWATGLWALTIWIMLSRRFWDNAWTSKQAARLFNIVWEKKMSTLEKYIQTGSKQYKQSATRVANELANRVMKLSPPSGKPLTSFPADFSPKAEAQYAAANRGASIANSWAYQGTPNTSTKIPKFSDEFKNFIETTAKRSGRDVSRYEKKLLALLKKKTAGLSPDQLSAIKAAEKKAKQLIDFFERNKLYNRYEK